VQGEIDVQERSRSRGTRAAMWIFHRRRRRRLASLTRLLTTLDAAASSNRV
jgi:hypothetical protein